MIWKAIICFVSLLTVNTILAKHLKDDCAIAKELLVQGFSKQSLPNWVCLVKAESGGNTGVRGGPNKDGSYDFGLFQINSRYWCGIGKVAGDCKSDCKNFLTDDITKAAVCAKKIFNRHGYNAWAGWRAKCLGKRLPDLSKCK